SLKRVLQHGAIAAVLRFSGAMCSGLIEAHQDVGARNGGVATFSGAMCSGLIEACARGVVATSVGHCFPERCAPASLKRRHGRMISVLLHRFPERCAPASLKLG